MKKKFQLKNRKLVIKINEQKIKKNPIKKNTKLIIKNT